MGPHLPIGTFPQNLKGSWPPGHECPMLRKLVVVSGVRTLEDHKPAERPCYTVNLTHWGHSAGAGAGGRGL
jgi:hypothetical protein